MIGGYENVIALPTMGVFDTSMMQADINAARELYNQARDDYKDFIKTHQDFYSISDVDNQNWYNMTQGAANKLVQQYGPDLLRSAEGRAAIQNLVNGVDSKALSNMRASAETMKDFIRQRDALAARGEYDPRWDKYYSNMIDPEHWDSSKGVWTRTAPAQMQTLHDLTKDEFSQMQPTEVLGTFKGPDGALCTKMGVSKETASKAFEAAKRKVDATPGAQMYKDIIREQLMNDPKYVNNPLLLEKDVNAQFDQQLFKEQSMYMQPKDVVSEAWKENRQDARTRMSINAQRDKHEEYRPVFNAANGYIRNALRTEKSADGKNYSSYEELFANKYVGADIKTGDRHTGLSGFLKTMSGTISTNMFASLFGNKKGGVLSDANRINLDLATVNQLKTGAEMMDGAIIGENTMFSTTGAERGDGDTYRKALTDNLNNPEEGHFISKVFDDNYKSQFISDKYKYVPSAYGTGRIVTIPKEDGRVHTYLEVLVDGNNYEWKDKKDKDGKTEIGDDGKAKKTLDRGKRQETMYIDLNYNLFQHTDGQYYIDYDTSASGIYGEMNASHYADTKGNTYGPNNTTTYR